MEYHVPVLANAVVNGLDPKDGETCVDGTVGGGGHALLIAERLGPSGTLIGLDQDLAAIDEARAKFLVKSREEFKAPSDGSLKSRDARALSSRDEALSSSQAILPHILLVHARFDRLGALLEEKGFPLVDAVLFDLGTSSHQLDTPSRGFTFADPAAPLDMRMDPSSDVPTAADLLNTLPERDLAEIFREFGDESWSARIAEFVCLRRLREPYRTSGQLVETVKAAIPAAARPKSIHVATKTFQALRIAVNDELAVLESGLTQAVQHLRPGGRLAVISFHSGEDRIVKRFFAVRSGKCQCPPERIICDCGAAEPVLSIRTKKPIIADSAEIAKNPRSRSAKLRIAEKREF